MSVDNVGSPSRLQPLASTAASARTVATSAPGAVAPVDTVELSMPASPPAEVRDAVGAAADRAQELRKQNRELHFEMDQHSGRVVIQVRDLEGNVLKTIPPSKALDVMSGEDF
jgi:flagellar protein FlaG